MSDLEKFKELYTSFGVKFNESKDEAGTVIAFGGYETHVNNKIDGYSGFFTEVEFDPDGKFLKQGFWE